MGFSCEADPSEAECQVLPANGDRGSTDSSSFSGIEMEFWPLAHPTEPSDEDQPVKCPMSETSATNVSEMSNDRLAAISRKRMESTGIARSRELITAADAGSTAARLDRKRHHTLTHGDIVITPIMSTTPPPPPHNSACKFTVLQMLHQKDSLEP